MTQTDPFTELNSEILSKFISASSFLIPERIVRSGWLEHGPFAFWLVRKLAPRTYVELGTHLGFSYFAVCQAVKKYDLQTACYAVDTWEGDEHAGFYDDSVYRDVDAYNQSYSSFSNLLRMTFAKAAASFPEKSIDLLHVDGRHFYDDVKEDFEAWRSKMTDDGVVLFHDTNVRERDFGVWRYFEELKKNYPTFEFLHGHGLGVLALGDMPAALTDLFRASEPTVREIRLVYAQLGANISSRCSSRHRVGELEARIRQDRERASSSSAALLDRAELAEKALESVESLACEERQRGGFFGRKGKNGAARTNEISPADKALAKQIKATGLFDYGFYRATNPDVVLSGTDPLLHFVVEGCAKGRRPNAFFDPMFYREHNPEIEEAGINPVLHFAETGWKTGRRPSPEFDPDFYLRQYPGLAGAKINPLVHYLYDGHAEGWKPLPSVDDKAF